MQPTISLKERQSMLLLSLLCVCLFVFCLLFGSSEAKRNKNSSNLGTFRVLSSTCVVYLFVCWFVYLFLSSFFTLIG